MKSNLFLLLLILPVLLFGQNNLWTKSSLRQGSLELRHSTTVDSYNNIYVVSSFKDTIDVDPDLNYNEVVSDGNYNVFVNKLSPNGNLIWTKKIGGNDTYSTSVIVNDNDLFITGFFNDTVDFNLDLLVEEERIAEVTNALFVLKLDLDGNYQDVFVTQISNRISNLYFGDENYTAKTIIDSQGNMITVGSTILGSITSYDLDPTPTIENHTTTGISDGYIQKLTSTGDFIWGFLIGGSNIDIAGMEGICGIQIDSSDNIYVSGKYGATTEFNPRGTSQIRTTTNQFNSTGYVARYSPNGILDWVSNLTYGSRATTISLSDTNLFVTGEFNEPTVFGGSIPLVPTGTDAFVMKMNLDGDAFWVDKFDTTGNGLKITTSLVDNLGNLYIAASQLDSIDFDFGMDSAFVSQGVIGNRNSVLVRYNSNGDLISARGFYNQQGENYIRSIVVDSENSIVCTGDYQGTTDFDIESDELNLTSSTERDWFLSKYSFNEFELIVNSTPSDSIGKCNGKANYYTLNAIGPVSYSILGHPNWIDYNDTLCEGYYIMVAIDSLGRTDTTGFAIFIDEYYNYVDTSNITNNVPYEHYIDDCTFDFFTAIDSAYINIYDLATNLYYYELFVYQNGSEWTHQDTIYDNLSTYEFVGVVIYCSDSTKAALKLNRLLLNINYQVAGIDKTDLQKLVIYPNPFKNSFRVNLNSDFNFEVFDNLGKKVDFIQNNLQDTIEFKLLNASEGIYFLIVNQKSSNENRIIKLIQK